MGEPTETPTWYAAELAGRESLLEKIRGLRGAPEYQKCLRCEGYFGLLFYVLDDDSWRATPVTDPLLATLSTEFDHRNDLLVDQ